MWTIAREWMKLSCRYNRDALMSRATRHEHSPEKRNRCAILSRTLSSFFAFSQK